MNKTKIELGDNKYIVDLNDDDSIKKAIVSEITALHKKYEITYNGAPPKVPVYIYTSNKDDDLKTISYWTDYNLYLTNRTISGSRQDTTVGNMKEIIKKVIKKCGEKRVDNIEKQKGTVEFKKIINTHFGTRAKSIKFEQDWNKKDYCKITSRDGIVIEIHPNYEMYVSSNKNKDDVIKMTTKLLA